MGKTYIAAKTESLLPDGVGDIIRQRFIEITGWILILCAIAMLAALLSYNSNDPSLNNTTNAQTQNLLGIQGAFFSDLLLQTLGLASALPAIILATWGWRLTRKQSLSLIWLRLTMLITAIILLAMALSHIQKPDAWPLMTSLGGVTGNVLMGNINNMATSIGITYPWLISILTWVLGLIALNIALGFSWSEWSSGLIILRNKNASLLHFIMQRNTSAAPQSIKRGENSAIFIKDGTVTNGSCERIGLVTPRQNSAKTEKRARKAQQRNLDLRPSDEYQLPPLDLLDSPTTNSNTIAITRDALQQNALLLEKVLKDFGVHGEITKVRPGPVVTLYELEPAPGTKTSRVISLSDDIARSMSAISVRVAVVPGRNVIGIELPNVTRELVYLRELLASEELENSHEKLKLAVGKDIGGTPIIVDLGRMPHLLIAGTTGSGKSVAINTMILSLLHQLTPDECKLIMIDPKMLELSVYDGIPHLLTPVVTDPSKAVVALKWAVREMEERYRSMSQLGVRNIASYNARLAEANKKGETLMRRIQTGFDEQGKPIFEEQPLSMNALPFIVVIVDEMADLMMVAGKDIEITVQRLAQMARAAGIHVIMATQRPSVDVITGTIKANFPTRISFQVTSKIDSRTILGEQGAEQLLGQGDMLYMAGGGRIMRVHGPFVSDMEVELVVKYLKSQGAPSYIEAITKDEDEAPGFSEDSQSGDTLYDEAVSLIAQEGKASTSFIQRRLQIGYNRAARIIERMEAENIVSKANRVGRREVLIPQGGDYST